ncbi:A24 family peptidase [Comamonas sp.]|uniref:A24 family peptidase n=1 Tax=Comamonas sp. TaxID=34028 RepID=UPI0028ADA714|nr:A24 family peptidase [Comamonas sp.]
MATLAFTWILLLWLVAIAVMDLRSRKVRNWMVLLGLATGLAALFGGAQPFDLLAWQGLAGMAVAFAALLPLYAIRWMGAGDVKFAAVAGLWFGLSAHLLVIWLAASVLAGLHGVAVLAWRNLVRSPQGAMLQAKLPMRWAPLLQPATATGIDTAAPSRSSGPARSIPYAGYMALVAIVLLLRNAGPITG